MDRFIHSVVGTFSITILGMLLTACDGGGSGGGGGGGSSKSSVNASGTWNGQSSAGISFTAVIEQNGKSLQGTAVRSGDIEGVVAGSIQGNNATWNIVWNAGFTGTYDAIIEGPTMSGTYEENFGDLIETGTFVATR